MSKLYFWTVLAFVLLTYGYFKTMVFLALVNGMFYVLAKYEKRAGPNDFNVAIVGAGFSGLCMAIKLDKIGIKYDIYEAKSDLGGTWLSNRYPGCASDIPADFYSFSFEPSPDWSKSHPESEEIFNYLKEVQRKYHVKINYNHKVKSATWDPLTQKYVIKIDGHNPKTANFVVHCCGVLNKPVIPDFSGLKSFKGQFFHSAKWDPTYDVTGKRVAVIGTGASAVQIIPAIREKVSELFVYQRTPTWLFPRFEFTASRFKNFMFRYIPGVMYAKRLFVFFRHELGYFQVVRTNSFLAFLAKPVLTWYIRRTVHDQKTAEKLIPTYAPYCKRVTPSDDYLECFNHGNVHLITDNISAITEKGVQVENGSVEPVDLIVFATGFSPIESFVDAFDVISGNTSLKEVYGDCPTSYKGVAFPGFPNFFTLLGPHSFLSHNSVVFMMECQATYIADCLRKMIEKNWTIMCPKQSALENFQEFVEDQMQNKAFAKGCVSWYRANGGKGTNFALWPSHSGHYWWITRKWDFENFECA